MADDNGNKQGEDEQGKKLHIDSDWKEQARAEKERLAEQAQQPSAAGAAGADRQAAEQGEPHELPPASLESLVQTLATQALILLTPQQDPDSGEVGMNLDLAKHSIDLLSVLEEKTRGNLTNQEKQLLDTALYQTRMRYVQVSSGS